MRLSQNKEAKKLNDFMREIVESLYKLGLREGYFWGWVEAWFINIK